jgi:hypothetical protein
MKIIKITFAIIFIFSQISLFAQSKSTNEEMVKMLEFSRPAEMHQLLQQLVGTWNFQDAKLAFVKGTLTRTSRYNNRFFDVEITGGKLQLPISGGMKEDNYRSFQLEGYDNVRKQFVTISVNNHIGSDIQEQTGHYDAAHKQLIYEWENELVPRKIIKNRRVITLVDETHYTEIYFEFHDGNFEKVREIDYSK